jgi:hypothetical protein
MLCHVVIVGDES